MNNFISQILPQDPKGGSKVTPSLAPTFLEKLLKLDIHQVATKGLNGITLWFSVHTRFCAVFCAEQICSCPVVGFSRVMSNYYWLSSSNTVPIPYLIEFVRRGFLRLVAGCIEPMLPIKCLTYSTDYTYNCRKLIVCTMGMYSR